MKMLTSGWIVRASAWGRTIPRMMSPKGMPSARAASICPFGTELIPLRTVSHTNPDEEKISATTTDQKSGIVIPTWGSARPMSTMRHRFGMLQATDTHAAPSARSGGMGPTRKTAMSDPRSSPPR